VFGDPTWATYCVPSETGDTASGQYVPTEVVQMRYDFRILGPDLYEKASGAEL
jgi:hypothetical protein